LNELEEKYDSQKIEINDKYIYHFVNGKTYYSSHLNIYDKEMNLVTFINFHRLYTSFTVLPEFNFICSYPTGTNNIAHFDSNNIQTDISNLEIRNHFYFSNFLYYHKNNSIVRVHVDDIFGELEIINTAIPNFREFLSDGQDLYYYTSKGLYKINADLSIVEIPLNISSSVLFDLKLTNSQMFALTSAGLFNYNDENIWDEILVPSPNSISGFDINEFGQLFVRTGVNSNTLGTYYSSDWGSTFEDLDIYFGTPATIGFDTLLNLSGFYMQAEK